MQGNSEKSQKVLEAAKGKWILWISSEAMPTARASSGSLFTQDGPDVLAIGFSSDWLYPTSELRMLLAAATAVGVNAAYHEVVTDAGHDGFLLPDTGLAVRLHAFLG